jgi:polar amino acid transport system substrate-binding protein
MPTVSPTSTWRAIRRTSGERKIARWLALVLAATLLSLVLLWQGEYWTGLWQRDVAWERIQRDGLLRVGMDASYPPFQVVTDDGEFFGLDVDLARALGAHWGVDVVMVNVHFDGLYDALRTNKFDLIISALPYDRTMTRDLRYSQSYFDAGQVLLVGGDRVDIEGLGDLFDDGEDSAPISIAVELGSEAHHLARRLTRDQGLPLEVLPQREMAGAVALLRNGEADGLLCDRVIAYDLLREHGDLHIAGPPLTSEPLVIAALIDAPILMEQVNAALSEWQTDGTLEALRARWF